MKLVYIKLNDPAKDCSCFAWPYAIVGVFNDGMNIFLYGAEEMGEIQLVCDFGNEAPDIKKSDAEYLAKYNLKKLPGNVVVQLH